MVLKGNKRSIRSLTKPRSIIFCAREASTGPSSYINRKHLDTEDMREKLSVPFKFAIYSRDGDGDFNAFRENYKRMRSISFHLQAIIIDILISHVEFCKNLLEIFVEHRFLARNLPVLIKSIRL